jgi:NTE family protein
MAAGGFKVGLALGGGAARGLAHIGILKELQRRKIPIDLIVGTSIGSLVGGAFAILGDAQKVEDRFRRFVHSRDFRRAEFEFLKDSRKEEPSLLYSVGDMIKRGIFYSFSMTRNSFVSRENFLHNIYSLIEDVKIENCRLPFAAVAADIETGEGVLLSTGSLRQAICASSAIPGLMTPIEIGGRTLIDGGWVSKLPVIEAFRLGADMVIASDISQEIEDTRGLKNGLDIMIRANAIRSDALRNFHARLADVVIRPHVNHIHWADFVAAIRLVEEGEIAVASKAADIEARLERSRGQTRVGFSRGKRLARAFF